MANARAHRELETVFRRVVKRCLECDANNAPSCDGLKCASGKICVQVPATCDSCSSVQCDKDPTAVGSGDSETNVGAIAGGVIGGVAVVAILVFLIWKYYLKGKRRPYSESDWQGVDMAEPEKADNDFASRRSARASTHTVASMASSVLTRASNIIQIAYIPGVTNRSGGPGSPDLLVPPVPPIPAMSSSLHSPYSASEQHFFVPDFRDSMHSTSTGGRQSIAPSFARNSVASTMYRQNAIVSPLPAQTVVRGKAAVVSVRSGGSGSPDSGSPDTLSVNTPPVPQIDPKHTVKPIRIQMPGISPQSSVRSNAQLGGVRALNLTKKKSDAHSRSSPLASSPSSSNTNPEIRLAPPRPLTDFSITSSDDGVAHARAHKAGSVWTDDESDEEDHARAQRGYMRDSSSTRASDLIDLQYTPGALHSPFSDTSAMEREHASQRPVMSVGITSYDASMGGSRVPMTPIVEEGGRKERDRSPFADSHRTDG